MEIKFKADQEKDSNEKMELYEKSLPDKLKMSTDLLNKCIIYQKAVKQQEYLNSLFIIFLKNKKIIICK